MVEKIKNNKIWDTFFVAFFIVLTIIFLLFFWLILEKNNNNFAKKYNEYFGQISLNYNNQIAKEVKNEFVDVFGKMNHFLDHLSIVSSTESIVVDCNDLYENDNNFLGWYLYDNSNKIICGSDNINNGFNNLRVFDDVFALKESKDFWFSKVALLEGNQQLQKNKYFFKIYKNFFDENKNKLFTLTLLTDVEEFAKDYFVDDSLWYGSRYTIVTDSGQIIWSSDVSFISKNIEDDYFRQSFGKFSDALNLLQNARLGKTGYQIFDYFGQEKVASYLRVPIANEYYWSVVIDTPVKFIQSEMLLDYTQDNYIFFYFVAFLLIIFLLVLYFIIKKNLLLQKDLDETKKEMIEEAKKFKISEIKLSKTVEELEKLNSTMVDRELKMIELKDALKSKKNKK
ncbi:MAG: hypothetical protein WC070_03720 [Candidatus Magasanikbacteria bacterium]